MNTQYFQCFAQPITHQQNWVEISKNLFENGGRGDIDGVLFCEVEPRNGFDHVVYSGVGSTSIDMDWTGGKYKEWTLGSVVSLLYGERLKRIEI